MPKTKITKKKVSLSIDKEILNMLKRSSKPLSNHINEILQKHFLSQKIFSIEASSEQKFTPDNRVVPCSNHGRVSYFKHTYFFISVLL